MSFNFNIPSFDFDFSGINDAAKKARRAGRKAKSTAKNVKYNVRKINQNTANVRRNVANTTKAINNTRNKISGGSSGASYSSPGYVTGGGSGGGGSFGATSTFSAPEPPKPPSEAEWLAGDGTYQEQLSEYDKALADFIARISEKEGQIKEDAKLALAANSRNRTTGMNNNAEDFASRGLINSGLYGQSSERLSDRYNESQGAIETNRSRGLGSIADERSNYEREVELSRNNARRSALQRMAAQFGTL